MVASRATVKLPLAGAEKDGDKHGMARFQLGNTAAVGNRGGGRPSNLLRDLTMADAPVVWRELMAIALDPSHPKHARHGFEALRTLANFSFPRPQSARETSETEAEVSNPILELAQRAVSAVRHRRELVASGACTACGGPGSGPTRTDASKEPRITTAK